MSGIIMPPRIGVSGAARKAALIKRDATDFLRKIAKRQASFGLK